MSRDIPEPVIVIKRSQAQIFRESPEFVAEERSDGTIGRITIEGVGVRVVVEESGLMSRKTTPRFENLT